MQQKAEIKGFNILEFKKIPFCGEECLFFGEKTEFMWGKRPFVKENTKIRVPCAM